jgi:hypothetical protein
MLRFFERKFFAIVVLLLIGSFPLVDTEVLGAGRPVNFPDPNLERVIRDAIRVKRVIRGNFDNPLGNIYESDLVSLTYVAACSEGISDLAGLEYCTNLTGVWLRKAH